MLKLKCFEGNPPFEVFFTLQNTEHSLILNYLIKGDISSINFPNNDNSPSREIGLWNHTCFEFFIKHQAKDHYFEFNFSPNKNWNLFTFTSIRSQLTEHLTKLSPQLSHSESPKEYHFQVSLPKDLFSIAFFEPTKMSYSPTTIVQTTNNPTYHYASAHPHNKLDFHRFESFDQTI